MIRKTEMINRLLVRLTFKQQVSRAQNTECRSSLIVKESFESLKRSARNTRHAGKYKAKDHRIGIHPFSASCLSNRVYLFDCTLSCHYCIPRVPRTVRAPNTLVHTHFDPTNKCDALSYFLTLFNPSTLISSLLPRFNSSHSKPLSSYT